MIEGMRGDAAVGRPQRGVPIARPSIMCRIIDHRSACRVELNVPVAGEQIDVSLNDRRFVAAVPEGRIAFNMSVRRSC